MNSIELEIDGRLERVQALATPNGLWVHFRGESYFVEKTKGGRARKREDAKGGNIMAPMPGKITKVLVKDGQEVTTKQNLVVMEAMKMEYNLRADAPGKVKKVHCAEGEQVSQDQMLVEFEES